MWLPLLIYQTGAECSGIGVWVNNSVPNLHPDRDAKEPGSLVWQSEHILIRSDSPPSHCPPLQEARPCPSRTPTIPHISPNLHTLVLHPSLGCLTSHFWHQGRERAVTPPGLEPKTMGYQTCTLTAMPKSQSHKLNHSNVTITHTDAATPYARSNTEIILLTMLLYGWVASTIKLAFPY